MKFKGKNITLDENKWHNLETNRKKSNYEKDEYSISNVRVLGKKETITLFANENNLPILEIYKPFQ